MKITWLNSIFLVLGIASGTFADAKGEKYKRFSEDVQKTWTEIFRRRALATPTTPEIVDIDFLNVVYKHFTKLLGDPTETIMPEKLPYIMLFGTYHCRQAGSCLIVSEISDLKKAHPADFARELEELKKKFPDGVEVLLEALKRYESGTPQG